MTAEQKTKLKRNQQYLLLGALVLLGMLLMVIGDSNPQPVQSADAADTAVAAAPIDSDAVAGMEQKLAHTLAQIQGAGTVTVHITVENMGRKEYAVDTQRTNRTTTEQSGDTNQQTVETQEQTTVVQQNQSGVQQALLVSETAPKIVGVLVVAGGADDAVVQERLLHAVVTALQIPMHQVIVVPGEEGRA